MLKPPVYAYIEAYGGKGVALTFRDILEESEQKEDDV